MKKFFMALACVALSTAAMAQDAPTLKYSVATNGFWNNWYVQAGADWSAFYSAAEHASNQDERLCHSPFDTFRAGAGFSVGVGKWFTPGIGMRTKFMGAWGRNVGPTYHRDTYKMWDLQEQVMLNINNLLCGYNPNRVWTMSWFGGAGLERNCSDNWYGFAVSTGLHSSWKLSNKVNVYLEGGVVMTEAGTPSYESRNCHEIWDNHNNRAYAEIGLTLNLGKSTWEKTPDVDAINALHQAEIDALNAQLNDANAEKARLAALLKEAQNRPLPEPKVIKEVASTAASVFFNIGKSKIASKKDLVNVQEIANYAKDNNSKLVVTGYADSATGSAAFNQKLSEKRAETVANALVDMGVSRDNITTVAEGGVDTLSPISYNRRATVKIAE